jgi:hypothetical protein
VYIGDAVGGDLLKELKTTIIDSFVSKYKRQEIDWVMGW